MTAAGRTVGELAADLTATQAELTALRDRHQRVLTDRQRHDERVRAAARREAHGHMEALAGVYAARRAEDMTSWITGLLRRVERLGERPSAQQLAELRDAAGLARLALRRSQEAEPEGVTRLWEQQAEITRLRGLLTDVGRGLHAESGRDPVGCECRGCRLIVGMDLIENEVTA